MSKPILYLIPNILAAETQFSVLPSQILEAIKTTNHFLVEELRTTRRFISSLKTGRVIEEMNFEILDKNSKHGEIEPILKNWFSQNLSVGIISEAGCPGVADPGALAVKIAHQLGVKVVPLVGPSSILMALMASGFSGQSFTFNGYLPINKVDKLLAIKTLHRNAMTGTSQIFMETPFRNNTIFNDLCQNLPNDTQLCIAADITSEAEFIQTKSIAQWKAKPVDLHKKPTIFIIGQ